MPDTNPITRPKRARGEIEKAARRQAILDAARELFADSGGEVPSVDQVARQAGLAKGTVYLYFGAKEEMFLALLTQELGDWIEHLAEGLDIDELDADVIARRMTEDLLDRTVMLRLAAQCHGTLERHVPEAAVVSFKQATAGGLTEMGALVESKFPGLKPGEGPALLLQTYALIIGLWQLADPPKSVRTVVCRPEFQKFKPDFASIVEPGLRALLAAALDN
jgi:TetR/AcrR family transcriptional regulator